MEWSSVVLIDQRGWLMLQERDEHAAVAPEVWSLCGGGHEAGESALEAAVRELEEETTIVIAPEALTLLGTYSPTATDGGDHVGLDHKIHVYVVPTALTDDDIDCREGRQICFVDPDALASLPTSDLADRILEDLISSPTYAMIRS